MPDKITSEDSCTMCTVAPRYDFQRGERPAPIAVPLGFPSDTCARAVRIDSFIFSFLISTRLTTSWMNKVGLCPVSSFLSVAADTSLSD